MANRVEFLNNGTWIDVSNYVISIDKIPYINRNRDYTVMSNSMNLDLNWTNNFTPPVNTDFRITVNDKIVFTGYVSTKSPNYDERLYRITILNHLSELDTYYIDYDTLFPYINKTSDPYQFNRKDSDNLANIQLLWILQCMFQVAGFSLDVSGVENVLFTEPYSNTALKYLCVDEGMFYCINQNVATAHINLTQDNVYNQYNHFQYVQSQPSFLSFFNEVVSILGVNIIDTDIKKYKLIKDNSLYDSIPDNNKFSNIEDDVVIENIYGAVGSLNCYTQNVNENPKYYELQDFGDSTKLRRFLRQYYYDTNTIHSPLNNNFSIFYYKIPRNNTFTTLRNLDGGRNLYPDVYLMRNATNYQNLNNLLLFWRKTSSDYNMGSVVSADLNYGNMGMLIPCLIAPLVTDINIPGTSDNRFNFYQSNLRYKIRRDYGGYTKTTMKIPIETSEKSVNQNMIDLNDLTSEIVQEDFGGDIVYPNPFN